MKPNSGWRGMSFLFCPVLSILTVEWKFLTPPDVEEFTPGPSALLETCGEASLSLAPHHSGESNRNGGVSAQPPVSASKQRESPPHRLLSLSQPSRGLSPPAREALSPLLFNLWLLNLSGRIGSSRLAFGSSRILYVTGCT